MRENRAKRIMKSGGLAIGAGVGLADPAMVEIIGLAGFDAVFIDLEHTSFDLRTAEEMIRAADCVGITSIVRVPDNNPKFILRVLDMGAQGIQVPHIANKADAEAAVQAVRYPPLGDRGVAGSSRAANYGALSLAQHVASSNEEVMLSVMIESLEALNDLESIAATDGLDLVAVGPGDFSLALGVLGQMNHPKVRTAILDVAARVKKLGKAKMQFAMMHPVCPMDVPDLLAMGVGYTTWNPGGPQPVILKAYQEQVKQVRSKLPK